MDIDIKGVSDLLKMLANLLENIKKVGTITVDHRRKLTEDLSKTAGLIEETLSILRRHLFTIVDNIESGNIPEAKKLIAKLNNEHEWEKRYRDFCLCDPLIQAGRRLDTLVNRELLNKVSIKDPQKVNHLINQYVRNERAAGKLISESLISLASLASSIDVEPQIVKDRINNAAEEVRKWREKFLSLERKIRKVV